MYSARFRPIRRVLAEGGFRAQSLQFELSTDREALFLDCSTALESHAENSGQVTDQYLAALADRHGYQLATLDGGIEHPAVELI